MITLAPSARRSAGRNHRDGVGRGTLGLLAWLGFVSGNAPAADSCGAYCPICNASLPSGLGRSETLAPRTGSLLAVISPWNPEERGNVGLTVGALEWLEGGASVRVDRPYRVQGRFKARLLREGPAAPAVVAGIGSFRPTAVEMNAYAVGAKSFALAEGLALSVYGGGAWVFAARRTELVGGAGLETAWRVAVMGGWDGRSWHAGLAGFPWSWLTLGVVMVDDLRYVTPVVGATFPLPW